MCIYIRAHLDLEQITSRLLYIYIEIPVVFLQGFEVAGNMNLCLLLTCGHTQSRICVLERIVRVPGGDIFKILCAPLIQSCSGVPEVR